MIMKVETTVYCIVPVAIVMKNLVIPHIYNLIYFVSSIMLVCRCQMGGLSRIVYSVAYPGYIE